MMPAKRKFSGRLKPGGCGKRRQSIKCRVLSSTFDKGWLNLPAQLFKIAEPHLN
jgi:hypothetical protein